MFFKKNRWSIGLLFVCLFLQTIPCYAQNAATVSGNELYFATETENELYLDSVSGNELYQTTVSGNETEETQVVKKMIGLGSVMNVSLFSMVEADTWEYSYKGSVQTFVAPTDAIYKLEVWGGQGAGVNNTIEPGGKGGYSIGYRKVKKGETIYVVVGQDGNGKQGGYNGGGHGGCYGDPGDSGYGGGGCTHMALANRGELQNYNAYRSEVLLVAGGGGGQGGYIGHYVEGGSGGGLVGGCVSDSTGGGTQTSPGTNSSTKFGAGFGYGGDGIDGNYNYGGGGGGWYGGRVACGSGGGSGYIGGVPAFTFSGERYEPATRNGVRSGNGYAKITMMKKLVAASLSQEEIEIIEKKTISIKADLLGAVSYEWQIQKRQGELPQEDGWSHLEVDGAVIRENVVLENGNGIVELLLPAQMDYSDCWIRILVYGEEENLASPACLLRIIPLKMEKLEIVGEIPDMEVGTVLSINTINIKIIYNNEEISQDITGENPLSEQLYFVKDDQLIKEYFMEEVCDSFPITIRLLHQDQPADVTFQISVFDLLEPQIHQVQIKELDYMACNGKEHFQIEILAEDNSNGILTYWYERKSDGYISEKSNTEPIEGWVERNDCIVIYVQDESGNVAKFEKEILYVDTMPPDILQVTVTPNSHWYEGSARVCVETKDELSGLHEMAYSFDGGQTWQSSPELELKDSADLQIVVRDAVGNISSVHCILVQKQVKKGKQSEGQAKDESFSIVGEFPYAEFQEQEAQMHLLEVYNSLPSEHGRKRKYYITEKKDADELEDIPETLQENLPEERSKMETSLEEKEEIKIPLSHDVPDRKPYKTAAKAVVATASTGGIGFLFFALLHKADIYKVNTLHQEEFVMSKIIWPKKKRYRLFFGKKEHMLPGKGKYRIRLSKGFCKRKKDSCLEIWRSKTTYETIRISEKMYIEL